MVPSSSSRLIVEESPPLMKCSANLCSRVCVCVCERERERERERESERERGGRERAKTLWIRDVQGYLTSVLVTKLFSSIVIANSWYHAGLIKEIVIHQPCNQIK